jgi:hypothetical protein
MLQNSALLGLPSKVITVGLLGSEARERRDGSWVQPMALFFCLHSLVKRLTNSCIRRREW